jgi:hypothetical protein
MNEIMKETAKVAGYVFAVLVVGFTSVLTFQMAARLVPGNILMQAMVLILFDVGAIVWFTQFLFVARGVMQWVLSGIGFLVGLVGAVVMAAGELVLGQSLVVLEDPTALGWVLVSTVICAALAHAILLYAFHFTDPDTWNRLDNSVAVTKAVTQAYKDARGEIVRQTFSMTQDLAASVVEDARLQIRAQALAYRRQPEQIDAVVSDAPTINYDLLAAALVAAQKRAVVENPTPPTMPTETDEESV